MPANSHRALQPSCLCTQPPPLLHPQVQVQVQMVMWVWMVPPDVHMAMWVWTVEVAPQVQVQVLRVLTKGQAWMQAYTGWTRGVTLW